MEGNKQNTKKGFRTLWIRYSVDNTDSHQLFYKEHAVRNQQAEYPRNKTLFVLNIPPYATTDCLKHAFTKLCGNVRLVTFSNVKGFKNAYIVFEKESSFNRAMELSKDCVIILNNDESVCLTGIEKWCKEYNNSLRDERMMKKEVEEYMASYDKQINNRIAKETAAKEDDDGWTTITSRKKRGQFAPSRKESTIKKVLQKKEYKKEKRKKELLYFYTFQIREAKMQNLAELRKKFELDKKRLQELKLKRTFKPF